jgi:hypothetical protein
MKLLFFLFSVILFFPYNGFSQTDIRDIKDPVDYRTLFSFKNLFIFLAVTAGLTGLYILIKKHFRKEKALKEQIIIRAAHEIAYQALKELALKNLPQMGKIKEYYIELSNIVRFYLERRFSIKVPEMTTEEFIEFMHTSDCLNGDQKKLLKNFLNSCDLVKFARNIPETKEIEMSFNSATRIVDETKLIVTESGPQIGR